MTPRFYHQVEKAFKQAYLVPLSLLRYGAIHPRRAKLRGCDNWIYIDPADPCAIKKVVQEPLRGKVSANLIFWREFNAHLKPELVVDVGLNYGECLFGTNYAPQTRLWGFEANPRLMPYLEQSRSEHPDGARMTLTNCLVADAPAENVSFLVNPKWSGQSSAVREINASPGALEFKLPARTLDAVIPTTAATGKTLLFKMDIEGYESRAMQGFDTTLKAVRQAVGFLEFTPQFMRWAGIEPEAFFARLQQSFNIYCYANVRTRTVMPISTYAALPARHGGLFTGADLLLASKTPATAWLPPGWQIRN
jgi:FkbM family methyltransferase